MPYDRLYADAAAWGGVTVEGTDMEHIEDALTEALGNPFGFVVGDVKWWPYTTGWAADWQEADGAAISRATYSELNALAAAAGYPDGAGDGSTTFNKPDLRKRFLMGRHTGESIEAGATGGSFDHVHTGPAHTHSGPAHTHAGPTHNHSIPAHSHGAGTLTGPSHGHSAGSLATSTTGSHNHGSTGASSSGPSYTSGAGSNPSPGGHTHSTGTTGNHSHTMSGATGAAGDGAVTGSTASAGSGTTGDASGNTGSGGTGNTGSGGTGNTGAANPPYRAGVMLIKVL